MSCVYHKLVVIYLDFVYNSGFLVKIRKLTVFLIDKKDFRRTLSRHLSPPPHQKLWEMKCSEVCDVGWDNA